MANREHRGHGFYIDNPGATAPMEQPAPSVLDGRRRDLPDAHRWQWWRWSLFYDPNTRRPSMRRLTLFRSPWLWAMVHWHVGPDQPKLHTHWSWLASLILRGGYDEERPNGMRRVRWWNYCGRGRYHRVAAIHGRRCMTLCFTGGLVDPVRYTDSPSVAGAGERAT